MCEIMKYFLLYIRVHINVPRFKCVCGALFIRKYAGNNEIVRGVYSFHAPCRAEAHTTTAKNKGYQSIRFIFKYLFFFPSFLFS